VNLSRRALPNLVTGVRLALLPVLWLLALLGHTTALGWLLLLAWVTDVLDGFLARRLRVTSRRGSRLDTVADHLLLVSMLAWVLMLEPGFVREQAWVLGLIVLFWAASLVAVWIRFRRFADLHLYSSKAGVFAAVVFTIHLLIAADYSILFFYLAGGICLLAAIESLAVVLLRDEVDEHIGSILRRDRSR